MKKNLLLVYNLALVIKFDMIAALIMEYKMQETMTISQQREEVSREILSTIELVS